MKSIRRTLQIFIALAVCLLLGAINAHAQDVTPQSTFNYVWSAPIQRENLAPLAITDIAGYDLQYRKSGGTTFTSVKVDATKTSYSLVVPFGTYDVKIAVYDKDGLYSSYVQLTSIGKSPPKPVITFKQIADS